MTIKAIETLRLGEFPNLTWVIVEDTDGDKLVGADTQAWGHKSARKSDHALTISLTIYFFYL